MRPCKPSVLLLLFISLPFVPCQDPPAPPEGFPIKKSLDILLNLSGGYRTKADFVRPAPKPSSSGWPVVILVHGMGGSRKSMTELAEGLATKGFAAISYDVRGQSDAMRLNPGVGTTMIALEEMIDLAEVIEWFTANYPGLVDGKRIGITGMSQGGLHSWGAAACSERVLPKNSRRTTPFPKILASVPMAFPPDKLDAAMPFGKSCHPYFLYYACGNPHFRVDPVMKAALSKLIFAEKYEEAYKALKAAPLSSTLYWLKTTKTAIFGHLSWHDLWADPTSAIDILPTLPASTPWRLYLNGVGHGSILNKRQFQRNLRWTLRWFNRYLKGITDGVEKEGKVSCAAVPPDNSQAFNMKGIWRHREDPTFPPPSTTPRRWYLTHNGRLDPSRPNSGSPALVRHKVKPGYTVKQFLSIAKNPLAIVINFPLTRIEWTTLPLQKEEEIAGFPKVELYLGPSKGRFQLHACLYAVSPGGKQAMMSSGLVIENQASAPGLFNTVCRMSPVDTVVQKGWRFKLVLENLSFLRFPPGLSTLRTVPFMESVDIKVFQEQGKNSNLVLPLRNSIPPSLDVEDDDLFIKKGTPINFKINAGQAQGKASYIVLAGFSGRLPGVSLPGGEVLPLKLDLFTPLFIQAAGSTAFPAFYGILSNNGEASPSMIPKNLPLQPFMAGMRMTFAGVVLSGSRLLPTTAVDLYFLP